MTNFSPIFAVMSVTVLNNKRLTFQLVWLSRVFITLNFKTIVET